MEMADLNTLIIFAKIVDAGSLSLAARRLGMPTSTVSRRLSELEGHLGVRLLERSTRRLRLTEIGSKLLVDAQRSEVLSQSVDNLVSRQRNTVTGSVYVSGPPSISGSVLTPLALAFQAMYPTVVIRIVTTDQCIDHIHDGVDMAFEFGSLKSSSLVAQRVVTFRPYLVASRRYLEASGVPQSPDDLLKHQLISSSHLGPPNRWLLRHINCSEQKTIEFAPKLTLSDFTSLTTALLAGAGIGSHIYRGQAELLRGELVEVLPDWRLPECNLSLVYPGVRNLPMVLRAFRDFAIKMTPTLFGFSRSEASPQTATEQSELVEVS